MAHGAVLGAGLGCVVVANEVRDQLGQDHKNLVINKGTRYSFVPSNPWVAVGWRQKDEIEVDLVSVFEMRDIAFHAQGAARVVAAGNHVVLTDGTRVDCDYPAIATGPDLALYEIANDGCVQQQHEPPLRYAMIGRRLVALRRSAALKNTSCARSASASPSRSMNALRYRCSVSIN